MAQTFFKRNEKKYVLTPLEFAFAEQLVAQHLAKDKHFHSTVYNVYFDTEHFDLIMASLESPDYKYKVRSRSYGAASAGKVFFEIKSKLGGVVYKRRAVLSEDEYARYLNDGVYADNQVMRELDWLFVGKSLEPKLFVAYDRLAYSAGPGSDLRITFDTRLRSRTHELSLTDTDDCELYFADDSCIMEVKTKDGMPLWLSNALGARQIYPTSFSKYGKIYQQQLSREMSHA